MAVKGCAGIRRGKEKRKRMEMSRELWNWIATGGMDVWLEKCSIFQNKEKSKRKQSEMSRELWLASNRRWWWPNWESNASNVSPHPLISLDSK